MVCAHWSIVYKVFLHHLYFPFLIYTIQAYIWFYSSKSLGSLLLHYLSQTLEGLLPYPSFNLLNDCIVDVSLLVSITYDCLFSKEISLYVSHNTINEWIEKAKTFHVQKMHIQALQGGCPQPSTSFPHPQRDPNAMDVDNVTLSTLTPTERAKCIR